MFKTVLYTQLTEHDVTERQRDRETERNLCHCPGYILVPVRHFNFLTFKVILGIKHLLFTQTIRVYRFGIGADKLTELLSYFRGLYINLKLNLKANSVSLKPNAGSPILPAFLTQG